LGAICHLFTTLHAKARRSAIDLLIAWFVASDDHRYVSIAFAEHYVTRTASADDFDQYLGLVLVDIGEYDLTIEMLSAETDFVSQLMKQDVKSDFVNSLVKSGFLDVKSVFGKLVSAPRPMVSQMFAAFQTIAKQLYFCGLEEVSAFVVDSLFVVQKYVEDESTELSQMTNIGFFLSSVVKIPAFDSVEISNQFVDVLANTIYRLFTHGNVIAEPYGIEYFLKAWSHFGSSELNSSLLNVFLSESDLQSRFIRLLFNDPSCQLFEVVARILAKDYELSTQLLSELMACQPQNAGISCLIEIASELIETHKLTFNIHLYSEPDGLLLSSVVALCNSLPVASKTLSLDVKLGWFERAFCQ
jgi:hypothetical protein